jgi:serine/threonine protein kinase/formylglycine-generating enzyme required for sulfatase activity/dienelactone hydrolase
MAAPNMATSRVEPGSNLLHYRLLEQIGEGGMGAVWRAVDTTLDRQVAIKVLPESIGGDAERLLRFEREAKVLASLNHPNVAAIHGFHDDGGVHFLAMELVRGGTLRNAIEQGLTPTRLLELAQGIADGLAAAHRQNIVHRDLKPANIMIDDEGRAKLLDFGLARIAQNAIATESSETAHRADDVTRAGTVLGTVAYMSPEQAQGLPTGPASDVFSLGVVLYEMTTRRRPFTGSNSISVITSILRDTPEPVARLAPHAPEPLGRIIDRCLQKDPLGRYADASEVRDALRALREELSSSSHPVARSRSSRARLAAFAGVAALLLATLAGWLAVRSSRQRWVRNEALPQLEAVVDRIQMLEEGRESWDAFMLAGQIEKVAPREPLLERLRPRFTRKITITSEPSGAEVYARYYDDPDSAPLLIGKTPLVDFLFPRGFTRVELKLAGHQPVQDVIWNFGLVGNRWDYRFPPSGVPSEMTWVPGGAFELVMPGLDHLPKEPTQPFLMDLHEVTNREYKRFVDAGGYRDPKYWKAKFLDGSRELPATEAMSRLVDRTGRPGPATWEVGSFPEGQDDYPVGGVSWYEAMAYAEWAGKSLPTIFHWNRVAFPVASSRIVPLSNLGGKGPVPVSSTKSMNRFGVSDLAGNVREWTWNADDAGARFILGGGWNDPDYAFLDAYAQPPFDRSPTNGFRCMQYLVREPNVAKLQRVVERPNRDFAAEKPVSDEVFSQYLRQFSYDRTPLNARIEEEKKLPEGIRQKVTFDAAYGGERMMAYLFLPPDARPPYQVVVIFPGSGAIGTRSSETLDIRRTDFIVKSGRAMLHPIYKHTYERGGALQSDYPNETTFYKDAVVMWEKDLARSIDYLESRSDIDTKRLAYYGLSWGGALGGILPAVEKRIKANVLYVAGLSFQRALPEVDVMNYVTRVKQPTLMLNGELDFYFPAATSQRAMFELLGTPPEHKKRLVYPGGHSVPRTVMIKESLEFLDRYLGPVGQ